MYAQDSEHRPVVLKLLRNNCPEHRVFKIILDKQASYPMKRIPGIVPVLDVIPFGEHWLAVMPRFVVFALSCHKLELERVDGERNRSMLGSLRLIT